MEIVKSSSENILILFKKNDFRNKMTSAIYENMHPNVQCSMVK